MTIKTKFAGLLAGAGALIVLGAGCAANNATVNNASPTAVSKEPIKIGFMAPLTGDLAAVGENIKAAVTIARDEINAAGGVDGRPIDVIFEDEKCDAQAGVSAATKLLNVDKITALIGPACSGVTLAVTPLAEPKKVPLISPASTASTVTDAGDYVFRFVPADTYQGKFGAEYLFNNLNKRKAAILFVNNDYGVGLKDEFVDNFKRLGGTVVTAEGFAQDNYDLSAQLTKIKNSNPDVLYFVSYTEASIPGLVKAKQLGLNMTIFGADPWQDPKIPQGAGVAAEGAMFSVPAVQNLPAEFIAKMKTLTGSDEIMSFAPRGYDILKAYAYVMGKVGADGETVKNELYNLKNYQGIADIYTMDKNGDMANSKYAVKEYKNGAIVEVK